MKYFSNERFALQCTVAIFALVPIAVGIAGMVAGQKMITHSIDNISLDSHFRYLSGLLFGIGICFWSLIPRIDAATPTFRLLTLLVFIGGLSRLAGIVMTGWPSPGMVFGLVMELIITPVLCLWQIRVAGKMRPMASA